MERGKTPNSNTGSPEASRGNSPSLRRGFRENVGIERRMTPPTASFNNSFSATATEWERGIGGQAAAANNTPFFQRSPSSSSLKTDVFRADTPLIGDDQSRSMAFTHLQTTTKQPKIVFRNATSSRPANKDKDVKVGKLIFETSYGEKDVYMLYKDVNTIGRREDNDICLPDGKISKFHAEISRSKDGYYIVDKNSSNGVRVNDSLIEAGKPRFLADGSRILIGFIPCVFLDEKHDVGHKSSEQDRQEDDYLGLVTILPSGPKYEDNMTIRAEIEAEDDAFSKIEEVTDIETVRQDYERLRLVYELSKVAVTDTVTKLLEKAVDLIFDILPIDRGVVVMVDEKTKLSTTRVVRIRPGKENDRRGIAISSTILQKVFDTHKCLIISDICEDPTLGQASSIKHGQIRSVFCVPLMVHDRVHGILHLDSRDRINAFSKKEISLVKAISNQTAIVLENMNLLREVETKARVTEQLSRFLPPHVVGNMQKSPEIIRKGGSERKGTIIFADIRGFTNLSEKSKPIEVVDLLNDYFERLVNIVFKYNGIVDKYIGDALMAAFGTIDVDDGNEKLKDPEFNAVAAALEFQRAIKDMNDDRVRQNKDPISVGVGVNTGILIAGFIGSSRRLEYTCIGDTVNTSSRICSMAQQHQVLISETTYEFVKNRIHCEPVGFRQFKGKEKDVMIYEACRILPEKD